MARIGEALSCSFFKPNRRWKEKLCLHHYESVKRPWHLCATHAKTSIAKHGKFHYRWFHIVLSRLSLHGRFKKSYPSATSSDARSTSNFGHQKCFQTSTKSSKRRMPTPWQLNERKINQRWIHHQIKKVAMHETWLHLLRNSRWRRENFSSHVF